MSFQLPVPIAYLIEGIQSNKYVLPAIQREFVWNTEQIEKLFDSLMRGYPIGSFLFWAVAPDNVQKFQFYRFMDKYHQRDDRHNEPYNNLIGQNGLTAVLDGQQRLTALNIGLRGYYAEKLPYYRWNSNYAFPERRLHLNLLGQPEDSEFEYEFKMLRERDLKANDGSKHWFKVGDILRFKNMQEVFRYCIEKGLTQDTTTTASDMLIELWRVIHERPLINFYLEQDQDLDKVLNIFIRVNSGGTILSYSDMLLSIATAQWQERDARKEIYEFVDEINDIGEAFSFGKDFALKACLVLADIQAIEFKVGNFNRENMLAIEQQWPDIARAVRLTVSLVASWGYNWQTLVSNNAVIPIAYYLYKKGSPLNFVLSEQFKQERETIHRWLMVALLKRIFSGQSDSTLRNIRRAMQANHQNGFPVDDIADSLKQTRSMRFDQPELEGLLAYKYGQTYTFSVLALLYPWLKYDQHFHLDHIFPRSMFTNKELAKRGIAQDKWHLWLDHVDDLANLQLLQGLPNQEKSDKEFETWLQSSNTTRPELANYYDNHIIPDVDLSFENFPEFLAAREKMIMERLAELLEVQLEETQVD
jgi:hypothetical protein